MLSRLFRCALSKLRAATLDLVALVADADAALIVAQVVNTAVDVFVDDCARLKEGLFDVLSGLGGGLHEDETVLASEHFAFVGADLAPRIQVALVSDKHDCHVRVAVLLDFFEPACEVRECVSASDVIDQECTCGTAVVGARDALEALLASRVPDLKLDILLLNLDSARSEFDANSQIVLLTESLVSELQQQA